MNPTKFIQPAFFHELFEVNSGNITVKQEHKEILSTLKLLGHAEKIASDLNPSNEQMISEGFNSEALNKTPTAQYFLPTKPKALQQPQAQEEVIAANVMPTINYILHSLQSFIVSSKQLINWSAEKIGINTPLNFTAPEEIEVLRKKLTKQSITIEQVAKLFEAKYDYQVSDFRLECKIDIPDPFKGSFDEIKKLIEEELKYVSVDNLKKLQEGKQNHWYDFKSLESTKYPEAVQIFKDCMAYITDLLIAASSILKGIANYIYHYHKQDQDLLKKNSVEIVSDLNRDRGNHALDWAKLLKEIEKTEKAPEGCTLSSSLSS